MKTFKKITMSLAALSIITTSSNALIFDDIVGATLPEQILQTAELIQHTKTLADQLIAETGIREIIAFQEEIRALHDFLENYSLDFMDLTNEIIENPKSQVGIYAKQLFEKYNLFDDCNYEYMSDDEKRICKSHMVRNVQEIATYQQTHEKVKEISEKLKLLSLKRESSMSVKESADIANAIQMELAQLQLVKTELDMMEAQNRSKMRVDQRQAEQLYKKRRNKLTDL